MAERLYDIKEIAKRTKESLAEKFPTLTFKVTFDRRGGSTMNVRLMKGDFNPFTNPDTKSLPINWRWIKDNDSITEKAKNVLSEAITISQKYNWDNSDPMTDYFDVNYYLNMSIGLPDEKPYEYIPPKSKSTRTTSSSSSTTSSSTSTSSPSGEVLMSCSGWTIYKKTLDDGRIVYNARINKDTTPNKSDWSLIKGEIYTETGFKWNRFGAFEKWGQMSTELMVSKKLCDILGKYYTAGTTTVPIPAPAPVPAPPPTTLPFSIGDEFSIGNYPDVYVITDIKNGEVYYTNTVTNLTMRLDIPDVIGFFEKGVWEKIVYEEPQPPLPKVDNTIPANPKLKFCRINRAEGSPEYTNLLPRDFSSFTQLTKFIADNIGQLKESGYDKHWIEWQWIWDAEDEPNHGDRWDIGENSENPNNFSNLFALNTIQTNLYYAWNIDGDDLLSERDDWMAEKLGKDGLELDNMQFAEIYDAVQSGYKPDKKRFKYNTPSERLARFKEVYPKTDRLFSNKKSKEDIQKAIKGLQYLADKGNENAKKAIKGLQYLLNK